MKEYGICVKQGKNEMYITGGFKDINSAKLKLVEMVEQAEKIINHIL